MANVFDQLENGVTAAAQPSDNVFDHLEAGHAASMANTPSQEAPDTPSPGLLESFGRGFTGGASFGYDKSLGMSKERDAASQKANPWTHFLGEMTGAVAPSVAATLATPEVAIPAGIAKAAPWLERGYAAVRGALVPGEISSAGQAIGQGAKLGATYGALAGSGNADVSPSDNLTEAFKKRAKGAVTGGFEGAIAGPVFGVAGYGLSRAAQGVGSMIANAADETAPGGAGALRRINIGLERDRTSPQALIDQIKSQFPDDSNTAGATRFWGTQNNPQPWTSDQVEDVVRRHLSGQTPSQISSSLSRPQGSLSINPGAPVGPSQGDIQAVLDEFSARSPGPLNIIDRTAMLRPGSGTNTQMEMRAAANTPGEAKSVAAENLLERQIGTGGRLNDLFDNTLGSSDYDAVAKAHQDSLEKAGEQAYGLAFQNEKPFDLSPVFNKWFSQYGGKRGPVPEGVQDAIKGMMSNEPVVNPITKMQIGTEPRAPQTLQEFIDARQNLKQMIDTTQPGTPLYAKLNALRSEMSNEVANTNPDWDTANQLWRDGSAGSEAMEAGANMGLRVNANSRENLKVFKDAQADGLKAQNDLDTASKALNNGAGTQADVDSAQARLDAANSRQNLFKVGLVRSLRDQVTENSGATHDLTKKLNLPGAKNMLNQVLGPDAAQFNDTVAAEAAMHRTYASQFGAQTTPLREAIDEQNWAPQVGATWADPLHWPVNILNLASKYAARSITAKRNSEMMGMYTNTNPIEQLDLLRRAQNLHQTRSDWGNAVGLPTRGAVGPLLDTFIGDKSAADQVSAPLVKPYQQ